MEDSHQMKVPVVNATVPEKKTKVPEVNEVSQVGAEVTRRNRRFRRFFIKIRKGFVDFQNFWKCENVDSYGEDEYTSEWACK